MATIKSHASYGYVLSACITRPNSGVDGLILTLLILVLHGSIHLAPVVGPRRAHHRRD